MKNLFIILKYFNIYKTLKQSKTKYVFVFNEGTVRQDRFFEFPLGVENSEDRQVVIYSCAADGKDHRDFETGIDLSSQWPVTFLTVYWPHWSETEEILETWTWLNMETLTLEILSEETVSENVNETEMKILEILELSFCSLFESCLVLLVDLNWNRHWFDNMNIAVYIVETGYHRIPWIDWDFGGNLNKLKIIP